MRADLKREAEESGRSISGEIEHRLERTFIEDREREAAGPNRYADQPDQRVQAADHLELDVREIILDLGAAFERRGWGADARAIAARLLVIVDALPEAFDAEF
jgi:hypothetical protein